MYARVLLLFVRRMSHDFEAGKRIQWQEVVRSGRRVREGIEIPGGVAETAGLGEYLVRGKIYTVRVWDEGMIIDIIGNSKKLKCRTVPLSNPSSI